MTAELEHVGSPRILVGTRADVTVRCYRDGQLATPTGTLTLSAVDADGDTVASATPTAANGVLTAVLTAAQLASVGPLTLTWGGLVFDAEPAVSLTTTVEVIGAWLFTLEQARRMEGLGNTARLNDEALIEARDRVTDELAEILGWRLGRTYFREVYDGNNSDTLWLKELNVAALRSVETRGDTTWTALSAGDFARCYIHGNGKLYRDNSYWPRGVQNIRVGYEAGLDAIPGDLRRASLALLAHRLLSNGAQEQASSVNNESGTYTLAKPGDPEYFTGLPSVDRVLARHRKKLPGIG